MKDIVRTRAGLIVALLLSIVTLVISLPEGRINESVNGVVLASQELAYEPASGAAVLSNCRYGVTPLGSAQVPWVSTLGAGWYLNFGAVPPGVPPDNGAEFAHVIRVRQDRTVDGGYLPSYSIFPPLTTSGLGNLVNANPGALWLVGNEVDRTEYQDDTYPEIYAIAYNKVHRFIKERDPSARLAISGLVEVTPGRLQYLDKVWEEHIRQFGHAIQVDVWNMHIYILPEIRQDGLPSAFASIALGTDPSLAKLESGGNPALCQNPFDDVYCIAEHDNLQIFAQQVRDMRSWMKSHGQQNKPLILSEYSILHPNDDDGATCYLQDEHGGCFIPSRVSTFMVDSFTYLNSAIDPSLGYALDANRLVQQWMWFAVNTTGAGRASNLVEYDLTTLTPVGDTMSAHISAEPLTRNLVIDGIAYRAVIANGMSTADADISISFRNNGNASISEPITVSLYSDAAMTAPIDSVVLQPVLRGCATSVNSADLTWTGLSPGLHQYWVRLESAGNVNGVDNVAMGHLLAATHQIFLPAVIRY